MTALSIAVMGVGLSLCVLSLFIARASQPHQDGPWFLHLLRFATVGGLLIALLGLLFLAPSPTQLARSPPIGVVVRWPGRADTIPPGWAQCNGAPIPDSADKDLAARLLGGNAKPGCLPDLSTGDEPSGLWIICLR